MARSDLDADLGGYAAHHYAARESDASAYTAVIGSIVSFVIAVGAGSRRARRVKTYNTMVVAIDPQLHGEHIPIVARD